MHLNTFESHAIETAVMYDITVVAVLNYCVEYGNIEAFYNKYS